MVEQIAESLSSRPCQSLEKCRLPFIAFEKPLDSQHQVLFLGKY